ncbi:TetR/AcrR family transcriptional regulator [Actinomadura harenae]|uniref:TetR/AcrR family transcriptional regulator n=1 Tax=Actinomadura harenae TaxID=2483351 RepID=A0A3M2LN47_9ACTN|nr:TetR/AcrR family transcriptional regulator [Actinomadura harenae]RMI38881.1 TetR/AcrR family transcriptional regulator [Actinomadura harenae]
MARPRTFDETRAVEAAADAFRRRGYDGTSTDDLCEATGLRRSSIYNAFVSKHDLFVRALAHFIANATGRVTELMEGDAPLREKVTTLLGWVIVDECEDELGCLVVNTSVELVPRDPEIARMLERDYRRRFEAVRAACGRAVREGELAGDRTPDALAHFILAQVSGLRIASRYGAGRAELEGIAATALTAL